MYGRRVHEAVLAAGDKESGCTVHFCDDEFDTGPIIIQRRCPVLPNDTPETLAARVFEEERAAYPEAIGRLIAGTARFEPRRTL
jgi:folate-dependent phosphoribosylglycinamide formyltransferase PurN